MKKMRIKAVIELSVEIPNDSIITSEDINKNISWENAEVINIIKTWPEK